MKPFIFKNSEWIYYRVNWIQQYDFLKIYKEVYRKSYESKDDLSNFNFKLNSKLHSINAVAFEVDLLILD